MAAENKQLTIFDFFHFDENGNDNTEVKNDKPAEFKKPEKECSKNTIDEALALLNAVGTVNNADNKAQVQQNKDADKKDDGVKQEADKTKTAAGEKTVNKKEAETKAPQKKEKTAAVKKPKKKTVPDILKDFGTTAESKLRKLMQLCTGNTNAGRTVMVHEGFNVYTIVGDKAFAERDSDYCRNQNVTATEISLNRSKDTYNLIYIDDDGDVWHAKIQIVIKYHYSGNTHSTTCNVAFPEPWRLTDRLYTDNFLLCSNEKVINMIKKNNPYGWKFIEERRKEDCGFLLGSEDILLMAPQLEQLFKAGYAFADLILENRVGSSEIECFNRLCTRGTNLNTIFKTPKCVFTTLKNETNLDVWDMFRKLYKKGTVSKETIQEVYHGAFNVRQMALVTNIMGCTYEGKPVFTWDSFLNYLHRVDFYEAIGRDEALQLLVDYLRSCHILDIKPKIDGDSLKREHDVTARTVRQKRDEIMAKKMVGKCEENKRNNYYEKVFFVRAIESYEDLIDEATQQHNCVASYASSIANGSSRIYVMREVANPKRSLITIELNSNETTVKQKLLAFNQHIRNKAQTEFIERWMKAVAERKRRKASSIEAMLAESKHN